MFMLLDMFFFFIYLKFVQVNGSFVYFSTHEGGRFQMLPLLYLHYPIIRNGLFTGEGL